MLFSFVLFFGSFFVVWSWFDLLGLLYSLSFVFLFFVVWSWFLLLGVQKEMKAADRERNEGSKHRKWRLFFINEGELTYLYAVHFT